MVMAALFSVEMRGQEHVDKTGGPIGLGSILFIAILETTSASYGYSLSTVAFYTTAISDQPLQRSGVQRKRGYYLD